MAVANTDNGAANSANKGNSADRANNDNLGGTGGLALGFYYKAIQSLWVRKALSVVQTVLNTPIAIAIAKLMHCT